MKPAFLKHPLFIIVTLFIAGYFFIQQYTQQYVSDEPVVLTKTDPKIIMYSTQSCMYCYIAKEFFKKHQLPYTEYNLDTSNEHMQTFYRLGGRGTPLLIVNNNIIHGYDEKMIREAL